MTRDPEVLLTIAVDAVSLAGEMMRTQHPGVLTAKGDRDYASEVDYAVERRIRGYLASITPDIAFLGEEDGGAQAQSGILWALDPVDGTVNFAHDLPLCGVSLALIHDGRPVIGVVELPFLGHRYSAIDGHGAMRDGRRIHVSGTRHVHEAVVSIGDYAVGADAERRNAARLAVTTCLAGTALRVRMFGSAAVDLAWVAEGRTDASVALSNKPWDTAAGVCVARAAGARVVDVDGSDHTMASSATIAAAPSLIDEVLEVVRCAKAVEVGAS